MFTTDNLRDAVTIMAILRQRPKVEDNGSFFKVFVFGEVDALDAGRVLASPEGQVCHRYHVAFRRACQLMSAAKEAAAHPGRPSADG